MKSNRYMRALVEHIWDEMRELTYTQPGSYEWNYCLSSIYRLRKAIENCKVTTQWEPEKPKGNKGQTVLRVLK